MEGRKLPTIRKKAQGLNQRRTRSRRKPPDALSSLDRRTSDGDGCQPVTSCDTCAGPEVPPSRFLTPSKHVDRRRAKLCCGFPRFQTCFLPHQLMDLARFKTSKNKGLGFFALFACVSYVPTHPNISRYVQCRASHGIDFWSSALGVTTRYNLKRSTLPLHPVLGWRWCKAPP